MKIGLGCGICYRRTLGIHVSDAQRKPLDFNCIDTPLKQCPNYDQLNQRRTCNHKRHFMVRHPSFNVDVGIASWLLQVYGGFAHRIPGYIRHYTCMHTCNKVLA